MILSLGNKARKALDDLEPKQFKQVAARIFGLQREPHPHDAKHLAGHPGYRRIDVGEFRICYRLNGEIIEVPVVARRNDDAAYRQLNRRA